MNAALERAGLPVPKFAVIRRGSSIPTVGFPAICKPAAEDASIGIEQRSVVRTTRALTERVGAMLDRWDEVIVQRYVEGREVNVGILGDAVLPIAEIDFGNMPKGMWRIVTYRSKWEEGFCDEDLGSAPRCPARLPASVASQLRKVAVRLRGGSSAAPAMAASTCASTSVAARGSSKSTRIPTSRPTPGSPAWHASQASSTARSFGASASSDFSVHAMVSPPLSGGRWRSVSPE